MGKSSQNKQDYGQGARRSANLAASLKSQIIAGLLLGRSELVAYSKALHRIVKETLNVVRSMGGLSLNLVYQHVDGRVPETFLIGADSLQNLVSQPPFYGAPMPHASITSPVEQKVYRKIIESIGTFEFNQSTYARPIN